MSKLAPPLETALSMWRVRTGSDAARVTTAVPAADEQVVVVVTHEGDAEALRQAGLSTSFADARVASGRVAFRDLERLAAVPTVLYIEMEPHVGPLLDGTVSEMRVPWKVPPATPWPGRGAGVIVAVIDTGIDVFHESFRKADGTTRILELWDQSATTGGAAPPSGFDQIGRVYNASQINAGINAGPPFASVDANGHGTHVAGIAAGNGRQDDRCSFPGRYVGVAPEADLVIVKAIGLPEGSRSNTGDALRWCSQAGARHGNKPVVINCSFGASAGPHDGTGVLDGFVDRLLRPSTGVPAGLAIVCAAGNDGNTEIHERGTIPAGGSATVSFTIPSGSFKDDDLEIWYSGTATLDLTLTAPPNPAQPGPNSIGPISPGAPGSPFTIGGMRIAVSSSTAPIAAHTNQKQISVRWTVVARTSLGAAMTAAATSITVNSATNFPTSGSYRIRIGTEKLLVTGGQGTTTWTVTRGVDGTTAAVHNNGDVVEQVSNLVIRPGPWQLTLANTSSAAANWRAWFSTTPRGDSHPTFRLSSESDMVERRRNDTVNEPGSSVNAITVANYSDGSKEISESSSRGPASSPSGASVHELKPTIAAPGTGVAAPRSRDDKQTNSSCCDQLVVDKSGTSMASPHVAGLVALMLEKNRTLTFEAIRRHLQRTARIDDIPSAEIPPVFDTTQNIRAGHIWGAGKVDAAAALTDVPAGPSSSPRGGGGEAGGDEDFFWVNQDEWGYTPHTIFSRLGEWRRRFGPRPGVMLAAALVSEHFDEVLRLVNHNRRVGAVWRASGGPQLARHLLFGTHGHATLLPAAVDGCDVAALVARFLPVLTRFGGPKLRSDIERYAPFVTAWPGASVHLLDERAVALKGPA